jgi:O-antigen chain-terminating methyltransferase
MIHELTDAALGRTDRPPTLATKVTPTSVAADLGVISEHAHVDSMPNPPGSLAALKKAVLRIGAFNWMRQRAVNVSTGNTLSFLVAELAELRATSAQDERRAAAAESAIEAAINDLRRVIPSAEEHQMTARRLADVEAAVHESGTGIQSLVARHSAEIAALTTRLQHTETRLLTEQRHTSALRRELARARDGDTSTGYESPEPLARDVSELYARFEAAFRPSDAELEQRFADYLDLLEGLSGGTHPLIDLGAGRGEFVEMLTAKGIPARGVDLNPDAVEEAKSNGRPVELDEAVGYLSRLDSESVGAVSAFHVIEHLDPETVLHVLDESLRVLRPGGLLILETPNPTNLTVGAAAFYHDPTHLRPVTPTYLEFLVRDRGFTDVQTRFLHPLPEYALDIAVDGPAGPATKMLLDDLRWALKGPQDFAVIAQRATRS